MSDERLPDDMFGHWSYHMLKEKEYRDQLDLFMKEEYAKTKPKPNEMVGEHGWYAKKKREFDERFKSEEV